MCLQQPPLPPSARAAMSTVNLGAGLQTNQVNKFQPGSAGSNTVIPGHNLNSSNGNNYNTSSKSHQISPGHMMDKLSEYSRRKQESDRRKVAERELYNLNLKICVVCLAAAATMQTFPCGHKVVCRKCLIKTIQVAVSQRCLPLRCVICRDRILTLHHTTQLQSATFGAAFQHSPELPSTMITVMPQASRPAYSHTAATIPSGLFSFIAGSRYHGSSLRPGSPGGHTAPVSPSSVNIIDNVSKLACLPSDDDIMRYAPSDFEAFVNSHNDALNIQRSDKPGEHKAIQKYNQRNLVTNNRRGEVTPHSFMHSQPVKIHPAATDHPMTFMNPPGPDNTVLATLGSGNLTQKSVGASRFLAKFLPRKSKRYSWFRHEN